ncbi:MAG: YkgJ family cysteine cluster protein [Planctomycetota bacterium]
MTEVAPDHLLPLTCTRSGTCCHGKDIRITPWELALLARARGLDAREFRERFTVDGGAGLACNGAARWRGLPACGQYDSIRGCTVHAARPLACRLYPLGRQRQGDTVTFMHEGTRFPCLDGCPEVTALPRLTVRDYLAGQHIEPFAVVRDMYLELAQDLAEGAFVLVFDSGLVKVEGIDWRSAWRHVVRGGVPQWQAAMPSELRDGVTVPTVAAALDDGPTWVAAHANVLQNAVNQTWLTQADPLRHCTGSAAMLAGAMMILHGIGADTLEAGKRWLIEAERHAQ